MAAPKAHWLGKKTGKVDLDGAVFGERFHGPLVHEAARADLAARRRGTASTKTRAEIAMTGALSAGQRTGGGVIFGPKPRSYTVKVNRKARRRALRAALTVHAERDTVALVDADAFDAPSTKQAAELLAGFGDGGRVLVVLSDGEETCLKSFRNIKHVTVRHANDTGVADVIGAPYLVLSQAALDRLTAVAS